jgi:hypothetical protein
MDTSAGVNDVACGMWHILLFFVFLMIPLSSLDRGHMQARGFGWFWFLVSGVEMQSRRLILTILFCRVIVLFSTGFLPFRFSYLIASSTLERKQ